MSDVILDESSDQLSNCDYSGGQTITMNVSFAVYLVCLIAFVGWVLFIVFAGVGLLAIPLDLIFEFKNRPR